MVLEIVGSRVLAPYVGSTIYTWTSLIGLILASLSLGYYLGGLLADKKPTFSPLCFIVFLSGCYIGVINITKDYILEMLQKVVPEIRFQTILATLILFAPPSILLGSVLPYSVKLKISSLKKSGSTTGKLYAISSLGSLIGTFSAGYLLIPSFGSSGILTWLTIILITTSFATYINRFSRIPFIFFIMLSLIVLSFLRFFVENDRFVIETHYDRVWIRETIDRESGRPVLLLITSGRVYQSGMFLDNTEELYFPYLKFFRLAKHFNPGIKKALMIGGGAYSYPRDFLNNFPEATLDVVEIDPKMTDLAKQYFRLKDNPRLKIFHHDGRTFLNTTNNKYDAIYLDVFISFMPPFQLTTKEAILKLYNSLNDRGVVLMNIVSAIDGKQGEFLRSEYATFKTIFPQVYLFPVNSIAQSRIVQNIILVSIKSKDGVYLDSSDPELSSYLKHLYTKDVLMDTTILTDDFAPIENYIIKSQEKISFKIF